MNQEVIPADYRKYIVKGNPLWGGGQIVMRFPNDYGASVVRHRFSYGSSQGLFELAVIRWTDDDWKICYTTPITGDVIGGLEPSEILALFAQIMSLENREYLLIEEPESDETY